MKKLIYIELILMAMFWGGSFTATKTALQELSPLGLITARFFCASILFIPILIYYYNKGNRIEKKDYPKILLISLLGMVLYFIFENTGVKYTDASKAALMISLTPIITAYLSSKILKEKINLIKKIAIIAAFFGAFLVITNLQFNFSLIRNDIIGCLLVFFSSVCVASYAVTSKKIIHKYDLLFLLGHIIIIAFFIFILLFFIFDENLAFNISSKTILSILYLAALASFFCYWVFYRGIKKVGVPKAAMFEYLVPVFGVIIAFLILNEKITLYKIIGGLIIIGSVYVFSRNNKEVLSS